MKVAELVSVFVKEDKQTLFSEFHRGRIMSWHVLFSKHANLRMFTFCFVAQMVN